MSGKYRFKSISLKDKSHFKDEFDLAFVGHTVDDRGKVTASVIDGVAKRTIAVNFSPKTQKILFDGEETNRINLGKLIEAHKKVLIDAPTLGLGEILKILSSLRTIGRSEVKFLYAEPLEYASALLFLRA